MAILHRKEEKIQAVLGRLPKKYTEEQFLEMFIKLYSKDWGKIKSAYIKQSQDKEPGTVINMPKPEIYLKQILTNYLQQKDSPKTEEVAKEEVIEKEEAITEAKIKKAPAKKAKAPAEEEKPKIVKKPAAKTKKVADKK
jgi:predicted transcriptional regulator YheO